MAPTEHPSRWKLRSNEPEHENLESNLLQSEAACEILESRCKMKDEVITDLKKEVVEIGKQLSLHQASGSLDKVELQQEVMRLRGEHEKMVDYFRLVERGGVKEARAYIFSDPIYPHVVVFLSQQHTSQFLNSVHIGA
ncbi:hypothetical protein CYMTET_43258 [Cymbomonas tetramitiformis]|uniref:Uncharacterized protein n=1 Tax=Cymbomonas tetramitiformis TaxID=36881 RepID=A0AAE0F0Q7_9CHLO|nr:hypothetical protein CYMTET_43258 [Cymbomonas tetramitiformis]